MEDASKIPGASNRAEEWKKRMKLLKEEKKLKKKLTKEEESRKKMIEKRPKDSKVVLIDENTLRKLNAPKASTSRRSNISINLNEFPELVENKPARKSQPRNWQPVVRTLKGADTFPSLESTFKTRSWRKEVRIEVPGAFDEDVEKVQEKKAVADQQQKSTRKKKRKDPIVLDLKDVLINKKPPKKDKKIIGSKYRKRREKEFLSGNTLDSSNPKRSKGKHRENKKKKLSRLKLAIVKERISKSKAVEMALKIDTNQEIDYKAEIEKYLQGIETKKPQKKVQTAKNKQTDVVKPLPKAINFSSKFREYCENIITPSLNASVKELIAELVYLQDRMFSRDAIKARAKRRHVVGFREVKKFTALKKVKMMIIAPDLEKSQSEGGIFDTINELKQSASLQNIPCVFALDRRKLGYCSKKKIPVSVFAVLNYEGLEARFDNVLVHFNEAREKFKELTEPEKEIVKETPADSTDIIISTFISALKEKTEPGRSYSETDSDEELNPFLKALKITDKKE